MPRIVKASDKPAEAPTEFTIFEVGEEQFVFCPVRKRTYKVNGKPEELVRQPSPPKAMENVGAKFKQAAAQYRKFAGSMQKALAGISHEVAV